MGQRYGECSNIMASGATLWRVEQRYSEWSNVMASGATLQRVEQRYGEWGNVMASEATLWRVRSRGVQGGVVFIVWCTADIVIYPGPYVLSAECECQAEVSCLPPLSYFQSMSARAMYPASVCYLRNISINVSCPCLLPAEYECQGEQ